MPEEGQDFRRRIPSVLRKVSDIRPDDVRVSVIGTVIGKAEDGIVLDDGTGKIDITLDGPVEFEPKSMVRVLGRVFPVESGFQLQGELVQDMSGLDMDLLKRVGSLEENAAK
jgi:uncharacterized protein YdeI (BOF family)